MHIIIGLGNPGEKYKLTRHNAGFMTIDALAEKIGAKWETKKKILMEIAAAENIILAKPMSFMNESGISVNLLLSYYHLIPKKFGLLRTGDVDLSDVLTVIHDDLDIELGKYKIKADSRSAGHNGVQSIIDRLKTKNFRRIRIGIKTELAEKIPAEKFVLQKFNETEMIIINKIIKEIIELPY